MASDAHRWQAAMGALAGALVADTISNDGQSWSRRGLSSTEHAEDLLAGRPTPVDIAAADAVPLAIGLSVAASPLLVEPETIDLIDHVRAWLADPSQRAPGTALIDEVVSTARSGDDFVAAIDASGDILERRVLTGAVFGLERGIGAVPARLVSTMLTPDGRRGRRYLSRLVDRMLGLHRNDWYDPRNRRGPKELLPGVWVSNLFGLSEFTKEHPEGLVLSLCDVEGRLDAHPHQVTFHLDDTPKNDANPSLAVVIDDVLGEIAAARDAGQPVLVHCRHGASRTGLVLRLLLIDELDIDPESALTEAQCLWPHTSTWNTAWANEIERRHAQR